MCAWGILQSILAILQLMSSQDNLVQGTRYSFCLKYSEHTSPSQISIATFHYLELAPFLMNSSSSWLQMSIKDMEAPHVDIQSEQSNTPLLFSLIHSTVGCTPVSLWTYNYLGNILSNYCYTFIILGEWVACSEADRCSALNVRCMIAIAWSSKISYHHIILSCSYVVIKLIIYR